MMPCGRRVPLSKANDFKKKLTVSPFMPGSPCVVYHNMYKSTNKWLYIPKYFSEDGELIENKVKSCNFSISCSPRDYQKNVIETIHKEILEKGSCIACLYTGWGKTFAAIYIAYLLGVKTLIIVNKETLLKQWCEQIVRFLGVEPGIIQGKKLENDKLVTIGMIQSLSIKDYEPTFFEEFSFTIYDETHHYCSKIFSNVFYKIGSKYNLGLTATIKRSDKLEYTLEWFLGKVAVDVKLLIIEPKIIIKNFYDYSENTIKFMPNGKVNSPASITNISENNTRNDFLINLIKECYFSDRNILVLCDRKKQCEYLVNQLSDFSIGKYVGGMKQIDLKKSNESKVIVATFQMASEGYDNPKLDTLILASPKCNVEQAVGRILRRKNKNAALVLDVNDCISIFNNWNKKRLAFYRSKNFKVESEINTYEKTCEIQLENFSIRD